MPRQKIGIILKMLTYPCLVLQIQQLEEHLEKTKEDVSQLKSDLQENIELVSSFFCFYYLFNYYTLGL